MHLDLPVSSIQFVLRMSGWREEGLMLFLPVALLFLGEYKFIL